MDGSGEAHASRGQGSASSRTGKALSHPLRAFGSGPPGGGQAEGSRPGESTAVAVTVDSRPALKDASP